MLTGVLTGIQVVPQALRLSTKSSHARISAVLGLTYVSILINMQSACHACVRTDSESQKCVLQPCCQSWLLYQVNTCLLDVNPGIRRQGKTASHFMLRIYIMPNRMASFFCIARSSPVVSTCAFISDDIHAIAFCQDCRRNITSLRRPTDMELTCTHDKS
jgi:hypothetical protein